MSYVELHARSAFSFLRGSSVPEHLVEFAAKQEIPAIAVCDRNGVYSAPRAFASGKEHGTRAIVGSELTLEDGSVLPVLVINRVGYQNLCRMITRAQLRAPKGESRITWKELEEFNEGLLAMTGDEEGPLRDAVLKSDRNRADEAIARLLRAFGAHRIFVELQRHFVPDEDYVVNGLRDLAEAHRLPIVATNGVLYAEQWGRDVLDVLSCARHHTHLDAAGLLLSANTERHIKSGPEMSRLFSDLPEAIANTERIAVQLEFSLEDLGYEFPQFPVPTGETMDGMLRKLTYFGAQGRYGSISDPVRQQLERELDLIAKLGFAGYFLVVWDIVNFCREEGIMVQGRGSAANSALCYSLGITAVDPVGGKLLFERFLSENRTSWPDIDLDLPSGERREKVIQEVFRRYGRHGAAMTANVITYRGRSAMREIGKALNFSEDLLKRFSDLFASGDYDHTVELEDQVVRAGIPRTHERFRSVIQLYRRIYGLPRHLGQHSGGMVVCQGKLDSVVPLENASMPGRTVVQWDKDDCEDLKIIKIDLLGLGMMAVLQDCVEMTHQRGNGVDLAHIPLDDPATFELLQKAETVGTFQVESRAQMATLPRMKPACFYDVAIEVAIIRPGPISGGLTHPYLRRRQGLEPVTYIHPDLKPVLERTLGVPLYQEQMLKIAMVLADFNGSEAEELRRAISFHRSHERMKKVVAKLKKNMSLKRIAPEIQEQVVSALGSFALYGFPESHALSFALLAYASCWLKVHRAPEFYCGLLNNQPMGFYSPATLVKEARRRGIRFRPICVVRSDALCRIEEDASIRLGLIYAKGLHRDRADQIVAERNRQPFTSLSDLLMRVPLNKAERRVLAKIGALNILSEHRRTALWHVEALFDPGDVFTGADDTAATPLLAMSGLERLEADYDGTDLTLGPHPMTFLRAQLAHVTLARNLPAHASGDKLTIAGVAICRQRPGTAKGTVFVSLEDETGIANAIVRSELFEKQRLTITHEPFLEIEGVLQKVDGVLNIIAKDVRAVRAPAAIDTRSYDFH